MPTSAELLFSIAGAIVAPGWALLVFRPSWRWSTGVIPGIIVPVILGTLYTGLILTNFFGAEGGFGSLVDVARLFENRYLLLAGWVANVLVDASARPGANVAALEARIAAPLLARIAYTTQPEIAHFSAAFERPQARDFLGTLGHHPRSR